ncbi:hypothetical protein [Armatimonas sp.]|uniref:hypothetical protein n=1 Tax=Armatimonas sp. TaxID=1872638 RepID=UPI003751BBC7
MTKTLDGTTKNYSYDDAGNTISVSWSGGSISLSWDAESRLKSETTGGTTVDYAFNWFRGKSWLPAGQRDGADAPWVSYVRCEHRQVHLA